MTVREVLPVLPFRVAEMVVVPSPFPKATPCELISAMVVSEAAQVTWSLMS